MPRVRPIRPPHSKTIRAIRRLQRRHRGRVRRDIIDHQGPHQPDGRGPDQPYHRRGRGQSGGRGLPLPPGRATVRHLSGSGYHRHGGGGHGPQAVPHDLLQPPDGVGPESNGRRVGGHHLRRGAARRSGGQHGGDPQCGGLRHWR